MLNFINSVVRIGVIAWSMLSTQRGTNTHPTTQRTLVNAEAAFFNEWKIDSRLLHLGEYIDGTT